MHKQEDIVCNKHSGGIIGYANLAEISKHLLDFENSLVDGN